MNTPSFEEPVQALWFDGASARAQAVSVQRIGQLLCVIQGGITHCQVPAADWMVVHGGDGPHLCTSPASAGSLLLSRWSDAIALGLRRPVAGLVDILAGSWATALMCGLLLVVSLIGTVTWLAPTAADRLAPHVPASLDRHLGRGVLAELDRAFLRPSTRSLADRGRLQQRLDRLTALASLGHARLELRSGTVIGANAFALPGRLIVVTDELLDLLGDTPALDAVLAHELGHLEGRHSLEGVLRDIGVAAAVGLLAHDEGLMQQVFQNVQQQLIRAAYSRDAEREADTFAFDLLRRAGLSPAHFVRAMEQLQLASKSGSSESSFFASHPATHERVEAARRAGAERVD